MNKTNTAKTITKFAVGKSVTFIVATAIAQVVPTENRFQKMELILGSYALASMAAEKASAWTDPKFDEIVESFTLLKATIKGTPIE